MAETFEVLEWHEAVRRRPAMYIGGTGFQGFIYIVREFFSSYHRYIDRTEFTNGQASADAEAEGYSFEITGKQSGIFRLEKLRTPVAANINERLLLRSFDFAVLNALSEDYEFTLFDKDKNEIFRQVYKQGILQSGTFNENEYSGESLEIKFDLDTLVLDDFEINPHYISELIRGLAFLNKDRIFKLKYYVDDMPCQVIYRFEKGLRDLIEITEMGGWGGVLFTTELEYRSENESADICFAFWDYSVNEPFLKSFVNSYYTHEGGTHKDALLLGISKALKKYVKEEKPDDFFVITNRTILSSLIGAINVKMKSPQFYGSMKDRLSNKEIIKPISELVFKTVYEKLKSDNETAVKLIHNFDEVHWNRKWLRRL